MDGKIIEYKSGGNRRKNETSKIKKEKKKRVADNEDGVNAP